MPIRSEVDTEAAQRFFLVSDPHCIDRLSAVSLSQSRAALDDARAAEQLHLAFCPFQLQQALQSQKRVEHVLARHGWPVVSHLWCLK